MDSGNDFVVQVKLNCPSLYERCQQLDERWETKEKHRTFERNRGRVEVRQTKVYPFTAAGNLAQWDKIKSIVVQKRTVVRKDKLSSEVSFYATNKIKPTAIKMAVGIRNHWSIENKLHWVKDKILNEDKSKVKGTHWQKSNQH